jgi:hypothetical protein
MLRTPALWRVVDSGRQLGRVAAGTGGSGVVDADVRDRAGVPGRALRGAGSCGLGNPPDSARHFEGVAERVGEGDEHPGRR